jgi:hypothetical protein
MLARDLRKSLAMVGFMEWSMPVRKSDDVVQLIEAYYGPNSMGR